MYELQSIIVRNKEKVIKGCKFNILVYLSLDIILNCKTEANETHDYQYAFVC